jgi:GntR family transcriptional regulator
MVSTNRERPSRLDRMSFVPLYYQLQEILKEEIESGHWQPGDLLPSEPSLARRFGVSRVVVRQALAILADDRQISRVRGKGTFVAQPKTDYRAGGLSRHLASPRGEEISIEVLDNRSIPVERSIYRGLGADEPTEIRRITTQLSFRSLPIAITYSFFRRSEIASLEDAAVVGRSLPNDLTLAEWGIRLGHAKALIETSQCGQFEADRFGVARRSAVFLVLCTEYRKHDTTDMPFEVARIEYRGDVLRLGVEPSAPYDEGSMTINWELCDTDV